MEFESSIKYINYPNPFTSNLTREWMGDPMVQEDQDFARESSKTNFWCPRLIFLEKFEVVEKKKKLEIKN